MSNPEGLQPEVFEEGVQEIMELIQVSGDAQNLDPVEDKGALANRYIGAHRNYNQFVDTHRPSAATSAAMVIEAAVRLSEIRQNVTDLGDKDD